MNFKRVNTIAGWVVFGIAMVVYLLTMEKTASFWDCGEFIAAANKLQVVHPPGAPMYLMLGRFFSMFLPPEQVAFGVNLLSSVSTALAAMFIFWSITILAKRFFTNAEQPSLSKGAMWATLGAGVVGALSFVFQDTQWFNGVEAEVYAVSTMLTTLVFWMALKWSERANDPGADRLLIGIAYVIGLSLGVHLLNLLAIPAIALLMYFHKGKNINVKGGILAFVAGMATLLFIQYGVILELPKLGSKLELTLVNDFGLPFSSGIIALVLLLVGIIVSLIVYVVKDNINFLYVGLGLIGLLAIAQFLKSYNTGASFMKFALMVGIGVGIYLLRNRKSTIYKAALAFGFIMIGYLSYLTVPVRSAANVPIDINNPDNVFNLLSYLNREQYGQKPLLYGPVYTARPVETVKVGDIYAKRDNKYVDIDDKIDYKYGPGDEMLFPRAWSFLEDYKVDFYNSWLGLSGQSPSMADNLNWLYTYQFDYMYWRYFMWNFAGRQNSIQGNGGGARGNWESGLAFVDRSRVVKSTTEIDAFAKNKGRNHYYMIPLVLGLIGLILQFKYSRNDAFVMTALFILTGIAIVIFLNQDPMQPRERDYAYAGSFLAFSMWIGLAVAGLFKLTQKETWKDVINNGLWFLVPVFAMIVMGFGANNFPTLFPIVMVLIVLFALFYAIAMLTKSLPETTRALALSVVALAAPLLMGFQGWDDHNRHEHRLARATGANYLNCTLPDAILLTEGDNDTYPLWYAQEIEKVRPDVRIVNNSLLKGDWYIDQTQQHNGFQPGLELSFEPESYEGSKRNGVYYEELFPALDLTLLLDFIASDDDRTKLLAQDGDKIDFFPTRNVFIPVDKSAQLNNKLIEADEADLIVDTMAFRLKGRYLEKDQVMMLDYINRYINERPIYFTGENLPNKLGLSEFIRQEGAAFRLLPIRDPNFGSETYSAYDPHIDTDRCYDLLMNTYDYGNIESGTALSETGQRQVFRMLDLAGKVMANYAQAGNRDKTVEMYEFIENRLMKADIHGDNYEVIVRKSNIAQALWDVDEPELANAFANEFADDILRHLEYVNFSDVGMENMGIIDRNLRAVLSQLMRSASRNGQDEVFDSIRTRWEALGLASTR
ncbi:MAG: DUF2723 domain-containing protein [Saprospiraceae bacterium]|nr:DUF2723 domain-containing protein [Saprospiraceae bacterium]